MKHGIGCLGLRSFPGHGTFHCKTQEGSRQTKKSSSPQMCETSGKVPGLGTLGRAEWDSESEWTLILGPFVEGGPVTGKRSQSRLRERVPGSRARDNSGQVRWSAQQKQVH